MQWQHGRKGLNLWGYPGTGKTRTVSLILCRELLAGRSVVALGPGGFRDLCESHNWTRSRLVRWLCSVDLLYIDDFDKMNLTREMEKDLFAVLNNRMGRAPVMTTGNSNGGCIENRFHLGKPMVDRIRRYCDNIHFPQL